MVIGSNKTNVQFNFLHLQFGEQLHFKWVNRWVLYLKVSGSLHVEMLLFPACAGAGVSHQPSWCYQQLSEGHVPLWAVTAALHDPDGNRSPR